MLQCRQQVNIPIWSSLISSLLGWLKKAPSRTAAMIRTASKVADAYAKLRPRHTVCVSMARRQQEAQNCPLWGCRAWSDGQHLDVYPVRQRAQRVPASQSCSEDGRRVFEFKACQGAESQKEQAASKGSKDCSICGGSGRERNTVYSLFVALADDSSCRGCRVHRRRIWAMTMVGRSACPSLPVAASPDLPTTNVAKAHEASLAQLLDIANTRVPSWS